MSNDIVEQTLEEAFPKVDPLMAPYGARVLVQIRAVKEKVTASGIFIPEETKEAEIKYRNRVNSYFFVAGIVIVLLIALFLYRNNRIKQKTNLVLHEQKQKVESGVGCASFRVKTKEKKKKKRKKKTNFNLF
mgnify:CR=1 FL=1